jgi:predicted glycosyltransferase
VSRGSPHRILIHVQHLLGIGHLQRALLLAEALAAHGMRAEVVSGGLPPPMPVPAAVGFHQLAPARSPDAAFTRLVDAGGTAAGDAWRVARRRQLLDLFDEIEPHALITETFPFGRNLLRFELLPLLQAARRSRSCRQVITSIRDILQPKTRPARNHEIRELLRRYYDRVLVHGDPSIAGLDYSFDQYDAIRELVAYSGYITAASTAGSVEHIEDGEVLVSAGGSSTGLEILQTALAARPLTSLAKRHWRIRVSHAIDAAQFADLQQQAGDNTSVERNRDDFGRRMQRAALSVSQAGYNTVCDLLASHAAAVVVPFAEADEAEQTLRAERLQARGRLVMLAQRDLDAQSLAAAIERALALDTRFEVDLDGARHSAALIARWLEESRP